MHRPGYKKGACIRRHVNRDGDLLPGARYVRFGFHDSPLSHVNGIHKHTRAQTRPCSA